MGAMIEINLNDIGKLAQKINSYALTPSQKTGLLQSLGSEVEDQTKERFDTKLDPDGNKWHDITDVYRKYLQKHFPSAKPPLIRAGLLQMSIEYQLQGSETVVIGSPAEYADYHQNAKKESRRRRFLGLSTDNIHELEGIVDTFMRGKTA